MIKGLETSFSCAHFYNQPAWAIDKNKATFGKCYSQYGHGHDYRLQIEFIEAENTKSEVQKILNLLKEELDHKHLNFDISHFQKTIPTTENIALYCRKRILYLAPHIEIKLIRLYERPDLWVELR
ncbi:MAG: hypothetical protein BroJett040_26120 [Oligoflexia bacterium]|nr:MAG: hypothetical protein BroJett040_26120 [Oligoflexia bacterium]